MKLKTASAVLPALLFVTGCETYPYGTKQTAGGVLGAAGGGLLPIQVAFSATAQRKRLRRG